jgi:hypothetical protein
MKKRGRRHKACLFCSKVLAKQDPRASRS